MRLVVKIAATLLILAGIMWFLQGMDIVPGSAMTGDRKWTLIGAASVIVGVAAWIFAARRSAAR